MSRIVSMYAPHSVNDWEMFIISWQILTYFVDLFAVVCSWEHCCISSWPEVGNEHCHAQNINISAAVVSYLSDEVLVRALAVETSLNHNITAAEKLLAVSNYFYHMHVKKRKKRKQHRKAAVVRSHAAHILHLILRIWKMFYHFSAWNVECTTHMDSELCDLCKVVSKEKYEEHLANKRFSYAYYVKYT